MLRHVASQAERYLSGCGCWSVLRDNIPAMNASNLRFPWENTFLSDTSEMQAWIFGRKNKKKIHVFAENQLKMRNFAIEVPTRILFEFPPLLNYLFSIKIFVEKYSPMQDSERGFLIYWGGASHNTRTMDPVMMTNVTWWPLDSDTLGLSHTHHN